MPFLAAIPATAILVCEARFIEYGDEGTDFFGLRLGLFWDETHSEWVLSPIYFDTGEMYGVPFRGHDVPKLLSAAIHLEEIRPNPWGEHCHEGNTFEVNCDGNSVEVFDTYDEQETAN